MEAYAGKQFVGIDLHREQFKYPKVGWVSPRCWSTPTPMAGASRSHCPCLTRRRVGWATRSSGQGSLDLAVLAWPGTRALRRATGAHRHMLINT